MRLRLQEHLKDKLLKLRKVYLRVAKKIISEVKKTKIKVQIKIQGNELRADGKKR